MDQTGVTIRIPYDSCPLCGCTHLTQLASVDCQRHPAYQPGLPQSMSWQVCQRCNHCFTDGYFTDEGLKLLFSNQPGHQVLQLEGLEKNRYLMAAIVERVAGILGKSEGRWLDVGFGNGALLGTAAEFGFMPTGIDVRPEAVDALASYGFDARLATLEQLEEEGEYSVVSLADSLEHMPFPGETLSLVRKLLEPGGLLFVSCPNMDSYVWKVLTAEHQNPYWLELPHYHNFGRRRLQALLLEHHFESVHYAVSHRYRMGMEIIARLGEKSDSGPGREEG